MVTTLGNNIINAYTGGVQVKEIYSFGIKVWPVSTPGPANNEIWYTSSDGNVITPDNRSSFGASIVSNTYSGGKGVITFNGTVTRIGDYAFQDKTTLTSITFPATVTQFGLLSFDGCDGLTSPPLTDSITSAGNFVFSFCFGFSSVELPASLTVIPKGMFLGGSINNVTVPSTVTEIGSQAFMNHQSLTVIMEPTVPPTMVLETSSQSYTTFNNNNTLVIKVPAASLNAYLTAPGWSTYASYIVGYSDTDEIDFSMLGLENTQVVDVNTYGTFSSGDMEVQFTTINSSTSKYYAMGTAVRMYGGNSVTISSSNKTISQIEFTWTGTSSTSYEPSSDVATPSGYDYERYIWTGSANQVTLTRPNESGHWRLKSVLVTYQ